MCVLTVQSVMTPVRHCPGSQMRKQKLRTEGKVWPSTAGEMTGLPHRTEAQARGEGPSDLTFCAERSASPHRPCSGQEQGCRLLVQRFFF